MTETKAIKKWPKHGVLDSTKMFVKDYWVVASSRGLESSLLVKICLVLLANCLGSGREKPMGERERGWTERSCSVSLQYHFLQLKRPELTEFPVFQNAKMLWNYFKVSRWVVIAHKILKKNKKNHVTILHSKWTGACTVSIEPVHA